MAVDLRTEVKKYKDSLTNGDDEADTTDTSDEAETTDSSKEDTTEEPSVAPARQEPSPVQTLDDYSSAPTPVASPTPAAPITYPTIAEDQTGAPVAPATVFDTESKQYVGTGEPPAQKLEPITAESVQPVPDTERGVLAALQEAGQYAGGSTVLTPETAPSVGLDPRRGFVSQGMPPPRAELVPPPTPAALAALQQERQYEGGPGLPGHPTMVPRAQLVPQRVEEEGLPVTPTPPKIERGQLVSVPPGTAPKAQPAPSTEKAPGVGPLAPSTERAPGVWPTSRPLGPVQTLDDYSAPKPPVAQPTQPAVTGELAQGPPGTHPAGTEDEPYWPKSADQIGQLPAGSKYIDPRDGSEKTTPGVAKQPAAQQPAGQVPAEEPAITNQAREGSYISYQGGQRPIKNIIIHSSDGSEKGDINTLTGGDSNNNVSAHYYTTKDGRSLHFVNDNDIAYHAGKNINPSQYSNAVTIGIEQEHIDGQPWEDAEVRGTARTVANLLSRHPELTIDNVLGHSDIAPERKQDPLNFPWDQFRKYVQEDLSGAPSTVAGAEKAAPSAQPVTKGKNGFYQDEKPGDFLNGRVTTFATPDDIASGQDNGVGSKHLGSLDTTQVAGVAIPQWVLQHYFGNSTAAMRQARVDVVDPTTGKRLRVPIVDIGPGEGPENAGVVADMTPALKDYFGGDKNLSIKIVPKAGPDVMKNPQLFYDEQAAIKQGVNSADYDPKRQVIGQPQGGARAQTPEEAAQAQKTVQAAIQKQQDLVAALPEVKGGNVIQAYQRLDQGVDGVSPAFIQGYQQHLKQEAITQIRQKYPEIKTDEDAWKVAQTPAGAGTFVTELGSSIAGNYYKLGDAFAGLWGQQHDDNTITAFAKVVHPDYTTEGLAKFVKGITDLPTSLQRSQYIGNVVASLEPAKQAALYTPEIAEAADRIASPEYQQKLSDQLVAKRAFLNRLNPDPRMGSGPEWWAQTLGSLPANVTMALLPEGIRESVFASQIYADTKDRLRERNPNWSESQINETTQKSTIAQLLPQEALSLIAAGQLGRLGKWVEELTGGKIRLDALSGAIEKADNPALRALGTFGVHTAAGAGAVITQQVGANIAEGRPIGEGLLEAAFGGAVIAAPAGIAHGIGALRRPGERPAAVTEPPVEERPPAVEPPVRPEERPPVVEPPVEERPPVEEKPIEEARPTEEKPPAEERPPTEQEPDPEEALNKQNQQLLDRYKLQGELEKELPIEEKPILADITEEDARRAREAELEPVAREAGQPGAEGVDVRPEPGRPVVGVGDVGYPAPGGGADVPKELRPVPRALEVALPPEERAALQPLVDEVAKYPRGTDPAKTAFSRLFETLYKRFEPMFKAGGVKRVDNPTDFDGIAAARHHHDGRLELLFNHPKLEEAARDVLDQGNDPAAYLHGVLQEELIHHAQNLALRDKWGSEKAKGESFGIYRVRKMRELVDNWLAARDRAQKRNPDLAREMTHGLHDSVMIYGHLNPAEAEARFKDIYDKAKKGYLDEGHKLANIVSEMARQMLQLKGGNLVEPYWKRAMGSAIEWFQNALQGLKSLYAKLGKGQPLAKTELARMIGAMERKLATLERRAGKGVKAPEPTATAGEGFLTETPGAPRKTIRERLSEAIARAKLAHSLGLKSGESALLDYKETEPLSIALRREHSLRQAYGQRGKLAELERAFKSIKPADRARVTREWTDYIKAEQTKQPLPAVGADTMRLLNARKDTAQGIGGLLKGLNVHVKDSKGRVRPVRLIGDQYYPWRVSNDMRDIFNNRDGSRAAEFNQIVQNEIAAGNVKTREEFVDKFTHAISGEPHSNDHMSNVERARELRLPYSFYDFSPEAFLHYAGRATDRLAQIGAYGQKLSSKGKDLFDHTIEAVNQSGDLSYDAKRAIINRIASERKAAFARGEEGVFDRIGATGRKAATLAFLSNWQTSFGNFVSGASQNMVFGGPGSFLKTAAKFPFEWRKNLTDAEDRNILKANFRDVLHDYDLVTNPSWLQKMTQAGLKWGGQNLTENINRVFGMAQAKNILREFVRDYGVKNNPMTRERNEFILRRFGGKPDATQAQARLNALAGERGAGPLSDEFIRQYVMDVHGTYSQAQAPAHLFDNPVGKTMLQFQKWGFNTGRMANREYVMPLIRALKSGSNADKGYHILRTIAYLGTGAGAGLGLQSALNAVYRRDPKDPSLAEIGKAFSQGDYGTAIAQFAKRGWGALILSGFTGLLGNYSDVINNLMGSDPSGRLKDPMHPPAWGVIEPAIAFVKGWQGEGGVLPSETLVRDFATRIASPARVMYNTGMGLANSAGLHFPLAQHYAAQQDRSFARSRIAMFEAQDPVLQQKAAEQGTRAVTIQMAGRRPFDPYRDRILNGLGSGNEIEVNSAIREWLEKVPDNEKAAELKRIKQTISANSPLKVGGSTKPENVMEFLQWAKANLPEGEARRIYALAATYSKTALLTGMEEKSKPMHELSRLDYDHTKPAKAISPQAQVSVNARAAAQGRQVMAELVRRQQLARALQHR